MVAVTWLLMGGAVLAAGTIGTSSAVRSMSDHDSGASASSVAATGQEGSAPLIAAIELRIDTPPGRSLDLESLLAFAPGERLSEDRARRTLSNLHASGLFSDAEILIRVEPLGHVAVVVAYPHLWVEAVELVGELGIKKVALRAVLEQRQASPLLEDRVLRSFYALQDLYIAKGYRAARIDLDVLPQPNGSVRLAFRIDHGPLARIGEVVFVGELGPYDSGELATVLRAGPGMAYDRQALDDDAERLRRWLVERGYRGARVEPPEERFVASEQRIDLTYRVETGPLIAIEVVGADEKRFENKGFFSYLEEQSYDEALVVQTSERLRTDLQRRGHYRAAVSFRTETSGDALALSFEIVPGPELSLGEIRFTGNERFTDEELLRLMKTSTRRPFKRGSGKLVDVDLTEDLANLRSFYILQGFRHAEVGPAQISQSGDELTLTIPITAGARQRAVDIGFVGAERFTVEEILARIPLQPGGPFHPILLSDSLNALRALYEEAGYLEMSVSPELDWNDEETLVDIDFQIYEGLSHVVDRVILRGFQHTDEEVIRRFVRLRPGESINRQRLMEAERDLYRLGIFSRVDVELIPGFEEPERRDVLVRLEEGRRWRLAYGFSYHSDDGPGGLLSVSRSNIGGRGDRLQLDLRGNSRDARFRLIYDQPTLGFLKAPVTYSLFRQRDERESFTVDDLGAQIALTQDWRGLHLGWVYDYRLVDLSAESLDPAQLERQDRELEISSISVNLLVDRRDDPIDPTRGFSTSLQLEHAFPFVGAEVDFLKVFWQQTHYRDLGRFGVLAASFRFGAIEPLDFDAEPDPLVPSDLPSRLIPASERFFAGGRTTHRAFRRDQLGILERTLVDVGDDRIEAGGNGLLLFNFDYRFPIRGPFGGTVFADIGNVWADWRDIEDRDLRPGVGLGVRYRSPIGPLRLDIGWKLDREPGERSPVFFFSFGNPF